MQTSRSLNLELARLIDAGIRHWRLCVRPDCRECQFVERVLYQAEELIFAEKVSWDLRWRHFYGSKRAPEG